jgi:hypothetical protein
MPVVRDSGWVEREYGREKWPAIERIVDEVTTRESDVGRRVLSAVARAERYPEGRLDCAECHDDSVPEILHGRAEAGDITLEPPVLEAVGVNPANATTVVAWRSAP